MMWDIIEHVARAQMMWDIIEHVARAQMMWDIIEHVARAQPTPATYSAKLTARKRSHHGIEHRAVLRAQQDAQMTSTEPLDLALS